MTTENSHDDTSQAAHEQKRLQALDRLGIMDTPREPEFDELVSLAAAICGTPIGLITLLDEQRQWFKASIGLDVTETPRDISFCTRAIQQPDMFVVEDASADPRFADNPLVTSDPSIRFYAGMPIFGEEGLPLGTLCVIDRKPRQLNSVQREALKVLALNVNAKLKLRVERRKLQRSQAELSTANDRLRELVTVDALTGCGNRRLFDERLAAEMNSARWTNTVSLLLIDLDHFKRRNDTYGHAAGDEALRQMGALLNSLVRSTDTAVRYGGEEFAVLMPHSSEDDALKLAARILKHVRDAPWQHEPLTVSIGVAEGLRGEVVGADLLANADEALYRAKMGGRDRIVRYSEPIPE